MIKAGLFCPIVIGVLFTQVLHGSAQGNVSSDTSPCRSEPVKVEGTRIAWDYSTMRCISPVGDYPRLRRLDGNTLAVVYENGYGDAVIRYSRDEGENWSEPDTLFHSFRAAEGNKNALIWVSNPELIRLSSGELLAACNYRPQTQGVYPFSIAVRRSVDSGAAWSPPQTVYKAGKSFNNGCWEPSFLELPNGDIHIYFSNEGIFTESDEQDIEVLTSRDKGITWDSDTQQVCFRAGKRDGMPVACLAGEEILVSIEDNRIGQFKPSIIRNPVGGCWGKPVVADSPLREYAFREPLHDTVYAGAPYLLAIPSGDILLSYQTTRNRSADWELSTMEVAIGDASGRGFTKITRPFDIPPDRLAKWNSLALWNDHTVAALSGCNYRGGKAGVWMVLGYIITDPVIRNRKIKVDGKFGQIEWGGENQLFAGHSGPANVRAQVCRRGKNLCIGAEVSGEKTEADFYIYSDGALYKISCLPDKTIKTCRQVSGEWTECLIRNIKYALVPKPDEKGFFIEFSMPFDSAGISQSGEGMINIGLKGVTPEGETYCELAANTIESEPDTWFRLKHE